jgi:energy-coupling factor transporter transmembrane protein EcfT
LGTSTVTWILLAVLFALSILYRICFAFTLASAIFFTVRGEEIFRLLKRDLPIDTPEVTNEITKAR